jgi:voltage-gated potassium channel
MNALIYVMLRRLRMPLLVLIAVYAVSTLGLVLIPGVDDQGQPWRMDFFHAFYFVSFMGSTIGFGEVPYPFTPGQRMWTLVCIYATVIAWLYAIGSSLAILQDKGFLRLMRSRSFAQKVGALREPFYLVCGYGTTGREVVLGLERRGLRSVVIDIDQSRIDSVELEEWALPAYSLCADAGLPENLDIAGLRKPNCMGVLALTDRDSVNLAISIASKLVLPNRVVISRSENQVTTANLASFGTDLIIDPFKKFADYLGLAVRYPHQHLVIDWLLNPQHRPLSSIYKHAKGRWVLCGFGRFGHALAEAMVGEGTSVTVIEPDPLRTENQPDSVQGVGTEAVTLKAARICDAVGIIAGTPDDADNLSILMTARELNPKLTTVVRQNHSANQLMFDHSKADYVMQPGHTVATQILAHLRTPLLDLFFEQLRTMDEVWAHTLINRISDAVADEQVESRCFVICEAQTPAIFAAISASERVNLRTLMKHPNDLSADLECFALLHKRGDQIQLTPGELTELEVGDELLFCGRFSHLDLQRWTLENDQRLHYLLTGQETSSNPILRSLRSFNS